MSDPDVADSIVSESPFAQPRTAREHSYLPSGSLRLHSITQPLTPSNTAYQPRPHLRSLTIMPMDIVVFPGETLPIRLQESQWIQFLTEEIRHSAPIQFGILCEPPNEPDESMRRRQSWTRRGMGPRRLSEISARLLASMADGMDMDSNEMGGGDNNNNNESQQQGRVRARSLQEDREGEAENDDNVEDGDVFESSDSSVDSDPNSNDDGASSDEDEAPAVVQNYVALRDTNSTDDDQEDQIRPPRESVRRPTVRPQPVRLPSWYARAVRATGLVQWTSSEPVHSQSSTPGNDASESERNRVGTIVTVLCTHGDDNTTPANNHGRPARELIVTAVGTSRFRVISSQDNMNGTISHGDVVRRTLRKFLVEEIEEESNTMPSYPTIVRGCKRRRVATHCMAMVTPIPAYVYWRFSSYRLIDSIHEALERIPAYQGVFQSLTSYETGPEAMKQNLCDPVSFSFWLAWNLPLSQSQKLEILQLGSAVLRLEYIYKRMLESEKTEALVHCKRCSIPLTPASSIFTVGGADGTTGNYVNCHGSIHQTTTVRHLDEDEVRYQGVFSTRDSWFPGYGYYIMMCGFCASHLGWKFKLVDDSEATSDRPYVFFGLTATGISTY